MARSRNIKPGFFTNDILGELPALTRLLFAGIWTICDRDGRVEDRPKKIRAEILPYDTCDADEMLQALESNGFIQRYEAGGVRVIQVAAWGKHQNPHVKEAPSTLPAPDLHHASTGQELGEESPKPALAGLIPDSLSSDSLLLIPDSLVVSPSDEKPSRKKPKTKFPENFAPDHTGLEKIRLLGLNHAVELEKFRNHHVAHGSLMADWQAAFRTWLDKSASFAARPQLRAVANTHKYAAAARTIFGDTADDERTIDA